MYNEPVTQASGYILDIDGAEAWTIEAIALDQFNQEQILDQVTLCPTCNNNAGDGIATLWEMNTTTPFSRIKIHFTGTGNGSNLSVGLAFDNFYACSIQSELCGEITEQNLELSCDDPAEAGATYTHTFQFANNTEYEVTSAVISAITPEGISLSQNFWNFFQDPIAPGGTSPELTLEITSDATLTEITDVCFEVRYIAGDVECCHYVHCITLRPSEPCANISAASQQSGRSDCCYDITLDNGYCPDYFTGVRTQVLTTGVVFGSHEDPPNWNSTSTLEYSTTIDWDYTEGNGLLAEGMLTGINFCLEGIVSADQMPQEVAVHWLAINPDSGEEEIVCTETLVFNCSTCLTVAGSFECVSEDTYTYTIDLANNSENTANMVVFENHTAGIVFDPPVVTGLDLEPGGVEEDIVITITNVDGLLPGALVEFKAVLFDETDWCYHLDGLSFELEDCTPQPLYFNNDIDLDAQLENGEVLLSWSVAETHQFRSFSIVQSGTENTPVLSEVDVEAGSIHYSYRHQEPHPGTNFYQVIGNKEDGGLARSSLVSVLAGGTAGRRVTALSQSFQKLSTSDELWRRTTRVRNF